MDKQEATAADELANVLDTEANPEQPPIVDESLDNETATVNDEQVSNEEIDTLISDISSPAEEKPMVTQEQRDKDRETVRESNVKAWAQKIADGSNDIDDVPKWIRDGVEQELAPPVTEKHNDIDALIDQKIKEREMKVTQRTQQDTFKSEFSKLASDIPSVDFKSFSEAAIRIQKEEGIKSAARLVQLAKLEAGVQSSDTSQKRKEAAMPTRGKFNLDTKSISMGQLQDLSQDEYSIMRDKIDNKEVILR